MDVSVVEWLLNFGVAGLVIVLLITGALVTGREHGRLETENDKLREALMVERQRNADLMTWASVGARAFQAVADVAKEKHNDPPTPPQGLAAIPPSYPGT